MSDPIAKELAMTIARLALPGTAKAADSGSTTQTVVLDRLAFQIALVVAPALKRAREEAFAQGAASIEQPLLIPYAQP